MKPLDAARSNVGIVGAGRVGTALALAFDRAGVSVSAVASRSHESVDRLVQIVGLKSAARCATPSQAFERSDVSFLSVGDDAIEAVCQQLVDELSPNTRESVHCRGKRCISESEQKSRIVAHLSGALSSSTLSPLRELGASIASFHPVKSFSGDPGVSSDLGGTVITIEGDNEAVEVLEQLASAIGARPVQIESRLKPLYHAAACIASNYTVALYALAVRLMKECGIDSEVARDALTHLVSGTVRNLSSEPPECALTGPIARGDVDTVRRHLSSLKGLGDSRIEMMYRTLGLETVELALRGGRIPSETGSTLIALLHKCGDSQGDEQTARR